MTTETYTKLTLDRPYTDGQGSPLDARCVCRGKDKGCEFCGGCGWRLTANGLNLVGFLKRHGMVMS